MNDFCCYLDRYPLKNHYTVCEQYLCQIDWNAKSKEMDEKGVIYFDVSDIISLFPHLKLDENYALICYLSSEYHGIWGRIAAVERGSSKAPIIDPKEERISRNFMGTHFKLPEIAAPPMEAIYNDGTPEGYLEAVLCSLFLSAVPYTRFQQEHWDIILSDPPTDFGTAWNSRILIPDWRPRAIIEPHADTILVFRRETENGLGSSSGCDRIYLTQYTFQETLRFCHSFAAQKPHSMYRGQIDNDKRYTQNRRCCVSSAASILVAEEKFYK